MNLKTSRSLAIPIASLTLLGGLAFSSTAFAGENKVQSRESRSSNVSSRSGGSSGRSATRSTSNRSNRSATANRGGNRSSRSATANRGSNRSSGARVGQRPSRPGRDAKPRSYERRSAPRAGNTRGTFGSSSQGSGRNTGYRAPTTIPADQNTEAPYYAGRKGQPYGKNRSKGRYNGYRGDHYRYRGGHHRYGYGGGYGYRYGDYSRGYGYFGFGYPYYSSYYSPFAWSYCPYYRYTGPFSAFFPYRPVFRDRYYSRSSDRQALGAMDMDVSPEEAQIYVDGSYVGIADNFDGFPAFLWLEEGTYDIAIYHPGYETIVRQYSIGPGAVVDVSDRMQRGEAIHPDELMTPPSTERRDARIERNREREREAEALERPRHPDAVGRLMLSVLPPDAAVYLDGHFLGTGEELSQLSAGLIVEPGEHELEIVRPGYETETVSVTLPPGERVELNLKLEAY